MVRLTEEPANILLPYFLPTRFLKCRANLLIGLLL